MQTAELIMDPSGGDSIVILDGGKTGTHYIDLSQVIGISVGPGAALHVHLLGSQVTVQRVAQADGERVVERWLSLRKAH